jgi:hypothetical protein
VTTKTTVRKRLVGAVLGMRLKFQQSKLSLPKSYCCIPFCDCGLPRHPDTVKVEADRRAQEKPCRPSKFRTQPEEA